MSNKVQEFLNENFGQVRAMEVNNVLWFVAKDVAISLKYSTTQKVTDKVDDDDIISLPKNQLTNLGNWEQSGGKDVKLINEKGLHKILSLTRKIDLKTKQDLYKWLTGKDYLNFISKEVKETKFLHKLHELLNGLNINYINQYKVLNYKIDCYIPSLNVAIEYDENNHNYYSYESHEGRQKEIEKELGCKFIRVNGNNSDEYNIGKILDNFLIILFKENNDLLKQQNA